MSQMPPSSQPLHSGSRGVLCRCSPKVPAQRLVSHTEKNPERPFYRCRAEKCSFFKWEDEVPEHMWTTLPDTAYRGPASHGMGSHSQLTTYSPYAGSPPASYPTKRDSSMLDAEGEAYGMHAPQKRFKPDSSGPHNPGNQYGYDYRQPPHAPSSSQTTVVPNGRQGASSGHYNVYEWDRARSPPRSQGLVPSPFPLTPPGSSRMNRETVPGSAISQSPAFPPASQPEGPPSTQSSEFSLDEINEMIKFNLDHADDLEEQANSLRLQAKQLESLKSFLEKQERKRKATEKSAEFKANYILQLKAEIDQLKNNQAR